MAFETGTATGLDDLWTKFIAFITTDADLVTAGENWSVVWGPTAQPSVGEDTIDLVLNGPGLGGATDGVFVGLRKENSFDSDASCIHLSGLTGVLQTGTNYRDHINVQPNSVRMFVGEDPVTYWFIANGRRFIIVVKISTVYEACYGGFFLPFNNPLSYGYPLFVGGSAPNSGPTSWRSTATSHAMFNLADYETTLSDPTSAWMLDPVGNWLPLGIRTNMPAIIGPAEFGTADDWGIRENPWPGTSYGWEWIRSRIERYLGDGYGLRYVTLMQQAPSNQTFGVLDGAYAVDGQGNAAENIVTVGSTDHLVVQNVFRTGTLNYLAVQLD